MIEIQQSVLDLWGSNLRLFLFGNIFLFYNLLYCKILLFL